jgi:hypothetical protein
MEKCKKSSGLHWDIVLLCILNVPATLFGGPWMCVAQVSILRSRLLAILTDCRRRVGDYDRFSAKRVDDFLENQRFGSLYA